MMRQKWDENIIRGAAGSSNTGGSSNTAGSSNTGSSTAGSSNTGSSASTTGSSSGNSSGTISGSVRSGDSSSTGSSGSSTGSSSSSGTITGAVRSGGTSSTGSSGTSTQGASGGTGSITRGGGNSFETMEIFVKDPSTSSTLRDQGDLLTRNDSSLYGDVTKELMAQNIQKFSMGEHYQTFEGGAAPK